MELLPDLRVYVDQRISEVDEIPPERRVVLEQLANYISQRVAADQPVSLNFICTHNSRRSHLAQLWALVGVYNYGVSNVSTFSGGTQATAFNPRAVDALKRCGLEIATDDSREANPRYNVRLTVDGPTVECFSKRFDEEPNPESKYCAVMTCSQADQECPMVRGCDLRIAIAYEDPKQGDGTPQETELYDERCRQIAREMLYAFAKVKEALDSKDVGR